MCAVIAQEEREWLSSEALQLESSRDYPQDLAADAQPSLWGRHAGLQQPPKHLVMWPRPPNVLLMSVG